MTFDVAEDIAADVLVEILEHGLPDDLKALVDVFSEKNIQGYIRRCRDSMDNFPRNHFNENRFTAIVDESTSIPLEERIAVEID
jgi:hypothetical protein